MQCGFNIPISQVPLASEVQTSLGTWGHLCSHQQRRYCPSRWRKSSSSSSLCLSVKKQLLWIVLWMARDCLRLIRQYNMTRQAAIINHISNLCWETRGKTDGLEVLKVSYYHPDWGSEVSPHGWWKVQRDALWWLFHFSVCACRNYNMIVRAACKQNEFADDVTM